MHQLHKPALPLFITGLPRSGTTLVRLLFHKHPDIAIPHETGIIRKCYDRRWQMRLWGFRASPFPDLTEAMGQVVVQQFDRLPVKERNTPYKVINNLFNLYARHHEKTYWGEKTPTNYRNITYIRKLFPAATVIFVLRDPKAIFASRKRYLQQKRAGKDFWMTDDLRAVTSEFQSAGAHLMKYKNQFRILSYEDLVTTPEVVLRQLFDEIGIAYHSEVLNFYQIAEEAIPAKNEGALNPWHQPTQNPIDADNIDKWREELTDQEISQIDEATENLKAQLLA